MEGHAGRGAEEPVVKDAAREPKGGVAEEGNRCLLLDDVVSAASAAFFEDPTPFWRSFSLANAYAL